MAKILIVRLGAMGDILHALPAVTGIRAALPEATIGWAVEEKWIELLAAAGEAQRGPTSSRRPVVDVIHTVNTKQWRRMRGRRLLNDLQEIRRERYDLAIDFQGAIKSAALSSLVGARARTGFVTPREPMARFFYSAKFPRNGEHVIEQNHGLAAAAVTKFVGQADIKLTAPALPQDEATEQWAHNEIQRLGIAGFAIMNPGAGWGAKQWPAERFGEVARALAVHNLKTLVNAAPGEERLAAAVIKAGNGNALELRCTIAQLIAITRRARLFIGGDTGPLHLAAALEVPTVGLFGPTDPARTGPFGTKSVALRHPESKTTFSHHEKPEGGLLQITAEEAITAARRLLGSSHA